MSRKALDESFVRVHMRILARPRRRGWATLAPVMVVMLVLSDERTVPRTVAPLGSRVCRIYGEMTQNSAELVLTCISQAESPVNHSEYTRKSRSAVL